MTVPTGISIDELQQGLRTKWLGHSIFLKQKVGSTNDWAKELASQGAAEGTVVMAGIQTAGRGRLSRGWISPAGGLWFSVILTPRLVAKEAVKLVFVGGLAVTRALREMCRLRVETKWPNDVLVDGRKVCGILAEANTSGDKVNFVVIGVGVNANFDVREALPEELWEDSTSLKSALGREVQLDNLLRTILSRFESTYELFLKEGFASVLREWKKYAVFLGCKVEVVERTEKWVGLALDVEDDGGLTVKLEDGTVKHILVGDVTLRREREH